MTESDVTVKDGDAATADVRCILRSVSAANKAMQGVIAYRAGLQNYLTLFAQVMGTSDPTTGAPLLGGYITLPSSRTAKQQDTSGFTTQGTQNHILTRRALPSDVFGADPAAIGVNYDERSSVATADNSTIINALRFFFEEGLSEDMLVDGAIRFRTTVSLKSSSTSGTASLQRVTFKLRQLSTTNTFEEIGSFIATCTLTNATTTYVDKSIYAVIPVTAQKIEKAKTLVLEITTDGKSSNASYSVYHKISFDPGTSRTYVEIPIEEA